MNNSVKKQLLANAAFISVFSLIFLAYCILSSAVFKRAVAVNSGEIFKSDRKKVVLDPGHGGEDCGAIGINGILEKDINLMISEDLRELLMFAGYEAVPTRTEDILLYDRNVDYKGRKKVLDLAARRKTADAEAPDIFVGIHMNAFPQEKYSGLTVYYSPNTESSALAAESVRKNVIEQLQPNNNREMKAAGKNIFLLDRLSCPAILIECGFLSNEKECALLSDEEYRRKLSYVIFSALSTFLEE